MPHKNERVELEMEIMRFRQLGRRITDEQLQKRLRQRLAELEQKLREIDECALSNSEQTAVLTFG
jgi:hypothetical protein